MTAPVQETRPSAPAREHDARPGTDAGPADRRHNGRAATAERSSTHQQEGRHRDDRSSKRPRDRSEPRTAAEWVTLAISSLIVFGLIGLTTYFHLTASPDPAIVEVEPRLAEVYQAGRRFYLPVTVRNVGGETGEEVRVRATLTDPTGRQEIAELMVAFLAGGGSTEAVVSFSQDPRLGQLEANVESYLMP